MMQMSPSSANASNASEPTSVVNQTKFVVAVKPASALRLRR